MSGPTRSPTERERLEAERDFLLRSLDDLDEERSAGNIDDESYRALHDDYTARAAATIRTLRDGLDARPETPRPSWTRWAVAIVLVVAFAGGSAIALAAALGARLPGETSSGNSGGSTAARPIDAAERRRRLEQAVAANPNDVASRLLLARFLEADDDLAGALAQYDAVARIAPDNAEALTQAGRILYLTAAAAPDEAPRLVDLARARLDRAVELDPQLVDARFFRAIVLANEFQDFAGAQNDLQRYLLLAPDGPFADQARQLLADVTNALEPPSTTVPRSGP